MKNYKSENNWAKLSGLVFFAFVFCIKIKAMRLKPEIAEFIKASVLSLRAEAKVYLFGSRVSDEAKGGDIDILILTEALMSHSELSKVRLEFFKRFGEQKLDLVNYTFADDRPFKSLALESALEL